MNCTNHLWVDDSDGIALCLHCDALYVQDGWVTAAVTCSMCGDVCNHWYLPGDWDAGEWYTCPVCDEICDEQIGDARWAVRHPHLIPANDSADEYAGRLVSHIPPGYLAGWV